MFELSGRILDWVDEQEGEVKEADFGFDRYAVVIEDHSGHIGRKYPIDTEENLLKSMDSFEKYASRMLPLHRRAAATSMARECSRYDIPLTEKVAMYVDDSIKKNIISYREAISDYSPSIVYRTTEEIIRKVSSIEELEEELFPVDPTFVKIASSEMSSILKESGVAESTDAIFNELRKLADGSIPIRSDHLFSIAEDLCKFAGVDITKTIFRDKSKWYRCETEKKASIEDIDKFVLENIRKLKGVFDTDFISKLSEDPTGTLTKMPEEICKKVADILASD